MRKENGGRISSSVLFIALIAALGGAGASSWGAPDDHRWSTEVVDEDCTNADDYEGADITLLLDAEDHPHIAYINGELPNTVLAIRYARWLGETWDLVTVDDDDTWGNAGLALDGYQRAHLSYRESGWYGQGVLRYARPDNGGWIVEEPDPAQGMSCSSIALDSQGYPHIAYYMQGAGLKYARWTGTEWTFATPDADCCGAISLALDSQDRPYISYAAGNPWYNVRCAWWDGAQWHWLMLDYETATPYATSIQLSSEDRPRIAYAKGAQNGVWYARAINMWVWMREMVEDGNMWSPVLALDADNRPHIAYYVANDGALAYATKSDETWDIQIVEDDASPSIRIGREPSIALGVCDLPRIAYYYHDSSEPCQLKYARARRPADFDGDGDVDTADLLHLLACWGTPCGDVDGDGDTDTADLLALLAAWGECP